MVPKKVMNLLNIDVKTLRNRRHPSCCHVLALGQRTFGSFNSKTSSKRLLRIQTFESKASVMVSALRELWRSEQIWRDLENTRSTETLIAGMVRISRARRAIVENNRRSFQCHQIGWGLVRLVNSEHSDSIHECIGKNGTVWMIEQGSTMGR